MTSPTAPRIRRTGQSTQFTYNLPRRVNDAQTYPVRSPQGATILLYGHANGVSIIWRGGRRIKSRQKKSEPAKKQNGASDDAVMLIDSEDEQASSVAHAVQKFEDKPLFEDELEETSNPEIVQTLDINLGTAVLRVAVMPRTTLHHSQEGQSTSGDLLSERMVFAVSCVSSDIYVVTVPLTPPSPESKARGELRQGLLAGQAGSGAWDETLTLLSGQRRHSDGLAFSLLSPKRSDPKIQSPRAIVASCSSQAAGTLMLWDVTLDPKTKPSRSVEPFQSEYLPRPFTSISFNPIHTSQLLTVSPNHAVRVYDYAVSSLPPDPEATGPFPTQGSWLLSLYQPFARSTASRKPILDAAWIAHGKAIFALLADGMWGVWDIDGASPASTGATLANKLKSGVRGGALTSFSISGYVEGTGSLRSVVPQPKEKQSGLFAPMTPQTRRQANVALGSVATVDRLAAVRGGVRVVALPSKGMALQDESLVLWFGGLEHVCVIPAVLRFWDSQLRRGAGGGVNLFSGAQPTRMIKLADLAIGLLGERCCGAHLLAETSKSGGQYQGDSGLPVDVLIQGESRLIIVRHGEEGENKMSGNTVEGHSRRISSKEERSEAIVVHGKPDRATSLSFDLSTAKPGTLRQKPYQRNREEMTGIIGGRENATNPSSRSRSGFEFLPMLNAAADVSTDFTARDVEVEMLDIMGIDQELKSMEDRRGSGRKKVLFEEH